VTPITSRISKNISKTTASNAHPCIHPVTLWEVDIKKLIDGLNPKLVIPVHTMVPEAFEGISGKTMLLGDGVEYGV
jgi:hypothetical protein